MKKAAVTNLERHLKWEAAKEKKIAKELLTQMVLKELVPMTQAQIDRAKDGDTKAFDTLLDRTLGPAKVEVTTEVVFSISSLAAQWAEQQKLKGQFTPPLEEDTPVGQIHE